MNMTILNQIVALVASLPQQRMDLSKIVQGQGECGTIACAIGHAALNHIGGLGVAPCPLDAGMVMLNDRPQWWDQAAADVLNCSIPDVESLFAPRCYSKYDKDALGRPLFSDKQLFLYRVERYLQDHPQLWPLYQEPQEPASTEVPIQQPATTQEA